MQSAIKPVASGVLLAGMLALAGCGNNYRPVISAISPVGPAGMPQKFAVVISNPNGNTPAAPQTLPGIVTFVDFSGDTVVITANIGPNPQYLALGGAGSTGYTINGDGTLSSFAITASLLSSQVAQTTLPQLPSPPSTTCPNTASPSSYMTPTPTTPTTAPAPTTCLATSVFPLAASTYVTQPGQTAQVGQLSGTPPALQQEISNIGQNPLFIVGIPAAPRIYSISTTALPTAGCTAGNGSVAAINTATNSVDSTLCAGVDPRYGVMTASTASTNTGQRAFILNHGSSDITVINTQQNTLDNGTPPVPPAVAPAPGNGFISDPTVVALGQGPIWADLAPTNNQLIVTNQGSTTTAKGSVSIFNIPLCSSSALASNANCNLANPIDAIDFGTLFAHIPVGVNPTMVAALQDGTQAYVINTGDSTVSVINLKTGTVTATIPLCTPATSNAPANCPTPNPTFIAATTGTPLGKVYVTSTTSKIMTVIRTDTNTIDTTVNLQGFGGQVRVTAP
jgi:YVTN family beta-propeller protein